MKKESGDKKIVLELVLRITTYQEYCGISKNIFEKNVKEVRFLNSKMTVR